ncbi:MAG: hypothetical protein IJD52_00135 [Alphaproteobacteria bacterium]|nr:hypothetical protein [Alphaproteobacteria bacterium]
MKKILAVLFSLFLITPASAAVYLKVETNVLEPIAKKYFTDEDDLADALEEWRDQLSDNNSQGISAAGIWEVCDEGGLKISKPEGKASCEAFIKDLLGAGSDTYYYVCGADKGKSGGTEHCIDKVFDRESGDGSVQVQIAQAIILSIEYIRQKYNDTVTCFNDVRTESNDDYIACKSTKSNTFYEVKFSDAKETDDKTIALGVQAGICAIHGLGVFGDGVTTKIVPTGCSGVDTWATCGKVNETAKKFGYNVINQEYYYALYPNKPSMARNYFQNQCIFNANTIHDQSQIKNLYGAPIDNYIFSTAKTEIQIYSDGSTHGTIRRYVEAMIGAENLKTFSCEGTQMRWIRKGSDNEDIIRCFVNGKQVDFVFDDLSESGLIFGESIRRGSKQALECIVSGGTYSGSKCLHLNEKQCNDLRQANLDNCPECKTVQWNREKWICELPSSAKANNIQRGVVATGIVVGAAAAVVITVATGGTGAGALAVVAVELAGAGIELASQTQINQIADDFLSESNKCQDEACAERLIGENLQRLANFTNDLTTPEEYAIDEEMARLLNLIPEDSEFYQRVLEQGATLVANEKGFFDADSWEPEQIWRAVGITLQLASLVTAAGKWIWTGGKTVTTKMTKASDVMRLRLTRAQAKHLDDWAGQLADIARARQASGLSKSKADELWAAYKSIGNKRRHLLNQLGNPSEELLPLLQREAYLTDDLAKARTALDDVIRQQDNLFMTNKNGQQVLRPGRSKHDVQALIRQNDELTKRIDDIGRELGELDGQITTMLGKQAPVEIVQTITTPGHALFDDGIANSARLAQLGILEVKNQTRKELDNYATPAVVAAIVATDTGAGAVTTSDTGAGAVTTSDTGAGAVTTSDTGAGAVTTSGITTAVTPTPDPDPKPTPTPAPDPNPDPDPAPTPTPAPDPNPNSDPAPDPIVFPALTVTPVPAPVAPITPHKVDKPKNTALIATAAVAGVAVTGGLIGGLIAGGRDKGSSAAATSVVPATPSDIDGIMAIAGGVLGYDNSYPITLIPLPTTLNTYVPIVNINNNAVVVVSYANHNLPYYMDANRKTWTPLLGIGVNGGWFNTYPNTPTTGIGAIDSITQILNQKLTPSVVQKYVLGDASGLRFPSAGPMAYPIINAEFPNGVVWQYTNPLSPSDQTLYNSNYALMQNMFK